MGAQQSTGTTEYFGWPEKPDALDAQFKHARTLKDGTYIVLVDKQGNPQNPVFTLDFQKPESQFLFKYSGLYDDDKDNFKFKLSQSDVSPKIKRLQMLLALLVVALLCFVATRRFTRSTAV